MKSHNLSVLLVLLAVLALGGCKISREQADARLVDACDAAIRTLLGETETLQIKSSSGADAKAHDGGPLRVVMLKGLLVRNKGREYTREYKCGFIESYGPFGMGYDATFYSLLKDGRVYGNKDGRVEGDLRDIIKITEAVDKKLR